MVLPNVLVACVIVRQEYDIPWRSRASPACLFVPFLNGSSLNPHPFVASWPIHKYKRSENHKIDTEEMNRLSSAVQWWDESQLRVLVLASLGVQYFLTFFTGGRKFPIPSWYRFSIWLSYLGSDALAIYALATLFNRQNKQPHYDSVAHGSRDLEVIWTPILLVHLGGKFFITAYNIEDNELWRRHIVTALSQVIKECCCGTQCLL